MHKQILVVAAAFAGLAVAFGAFGAHGLENITRDEKIVHGFQTGVQYQIYHALALVAVGIMFNHFPVKWMKVTACFFIAGVFLFSGSLYLLTFLKIQGSAAIRLAGPLTPLGGVCFIAGWLCLIIALLRKK